MVCPALPFTAYSRSAMTNTDHEELRQADLDALQMDSFAETAFDDLTRAAADAFGVPRSSITIMDGGRRWSKSSVGMPEAGMSGDTAFGTLAFEQPNELTVIEDVTLDDRFAATPLMQSGVRFYAAAPLTLSTGRPIGVMLVQDTEPHKVDPEKLRQLKFIADQVVATLEARKLAREFPMRCEDSTR